MNGYDKPYSFYDWIHTARRNILARGDSPLPLRVEPGGAEFAYPQADFSPAAAADPPDPQGRIARDPGKLIQVETTVVPTVVEPGEAVRVHLVLRPEPAAKAHWNNDAEGLLRVWLSPPPGWQVDRHLQEVAGPQKAVSSEPRRVEFELRCPKNTAAGTTRVPAYALYYVCEDVHGACLYRRQDIEIPVQVRMRRWK